MKIVFTGGGTGGHFYPIIAIVEQIREIAKERKLLEPELYYIGPEPYDERALFENNIAFRRSPAGKVRRYFSIRNIFDSIATTLGIVKAVFQLFSIYPDVVFSKGGYASFPTVFAARLLRIPVIIHESDASLGRVNAWAKKFAEKIAVSYPELAEELNDERVAYTGNPIRKELLSPQHEGADEFLHLEAGTPTLFFIGGSSGAQAINDVVLTALPELVKKYQIIHQTGEKNLEEIEGVGSVILRDDEHASRYHPFGTLNMLAMRMSAGAADLVISRAGSGAIFEIAAWGIPSIIIPIPEEISHDQNKNAFAFARAGAAVVIEQRNLTKHVLLSEIGRLMENETKRMEMSEAAKKYAKPDAARVLAEGILDSALAHES
ncbi:undecaprenyldiphospho-muramoylpentapeptide beta-N-acetylglucosaminyltransferase [Candidatus Kaiserbacteria bacterium CG10_big_fil_rev_8_21_14_0_10_49_17]|uniref:UDP-N-acetylglucosamine--N-acetylmuramyl-(pentapeptide) pyrophosphoryl-undecaprenol N-acetylglucosamine transferase n=1 Tax=Candidatus Kaiserbacteria bacterium CG10_big_fil_rev_8_21_14_0_10_49_17 TaxID=1974609 RepID=A0A2M6WF17_9BACT|nr:MAG: undecaprenyldiphospho-muramoylpentapeptide beta-N-acetylglucosaminyltransferase [Candidatus Kaiserbacteria bacterium CG10_big_fil_rev_8_21_14_0_10_49_17]